MTLLCLFTSICTLYDPVSSILVYIMNVLYVMHMDFVYSVKKKLLKWTFGMPVVVNFVHIDDRNSLHERSMHHTHRFCT